MVQHIRLVLRGIQRLSQSIPAGSLVVGYAPVVPRCQVVRAQLRRPLKEGVELHIAVAHQARVGCAALAVFAHEVVYDRLAEIALKVKHVERYAKLIAYHASVVYVVSRAATLVEATRCARTAALRV